MFAFKSKILRFSIALFFTALVGIAFVFLVVQFFSLSSKTTDTLQKDSDREYNILILGKNSNEAYLERVLAGCRNASQNFNTAIGIYTGKSEVSESSMQSLFDYASYLSADGVIAYMNGDEIPEPLLNRERKNIPLVTIGTYIPDLAQLSYIGVNHTELGKITATEILSLLGSGNKVIFIAPAKKNDSNYSTMMNTILTTLSEKNPSVTVKTLVLQSETHFSREDYLRQKLASEENLELIVPLTEENTILVAQSIRDLNMAGKVKVLGFGDSDECRSYYEKNIVSELICVKTEDIGQKAIIELFEFLNNGYANSYVSADIEVLKAEGRE